MADLSIGAKARRVLSFAVALGDPFVRHKLAPNGFDDEELAKGFRLVNAVSSGKLNVTPGLDLTVLGKLDRWENQWFPIVEVVLRTNFPKVHVLVFRNLTQTDGVQVIVSVRTLLDRIDAVAKPVREGGHPEGRDARALLRKRGFSDAVADEGRALLAEVGTVPEGFELVEPAETDPEAMSEAETRMWKWYLEWSGIARNVIRDRRSLRALGFLRRMRRADGRDVDVVVEDDDVEDDADVVTNTTTTTQPTAQPTPVAQPTAVTPKPEPEPTS